MLQRIDNKGLIVANKSDLAAGLVATRCGVACRRRPAPASTTLRRRIVAALDVEPLRDRPAITNVRHIALVERAHDALVRARGGRAGGRRFAVGGIRARRPAGGARRARGDHADAGRRTMCSRTSSRGSASANDDGVARSESRSQACSDRRFDVIVIGAGHAGCEAAYAAARLGAHVGLCTLSTDTVAHMPCNPAVGGTAKGHLVREIDALGGLMGRAIDATGIQFKLLNRSRGPAVWSPRAQADKKIYGAVGAARARGRAEHRVADRPGRPDPRRARPRRRPGARGRRRVSRAARSSSRPGTFLNGLIHIGPEQHPAGRAGEPPSRDLAESLKSFGFEWGRLKTGTPPRLDRASIDFDRQVATRRVHRRARRRSAGSILVSDRARSTAPQIDCYLLHTNDRVRDLVRANIDRSPLFNGQIRRHRSALLPVARGQDRPLSRQGAAPDLSRAGGRRRARDLRQRLLDEPAARRPGRSRSRAAGARRRRAAAARLRGRVRLHPADGADASPRDEARRRAVSRRADQRHVRLRGSGGAGAGRRHQRGAARRGGAPASSCAATRPTSASSSTT